MDYFNNLVAGGDVAGYKDGAFYEARFDHPSGLVFDDKGERLFVSDTGNQRIRVVYLEEDNKVETVAGTGTIGQADGVLEKASFNAPTAIAYLPNDRLIVYDSGDKLLRLVDIPAKAVTTLTFQSPDGKTTPALLGAIWNLVYRPADDCLYFTEPDGKCLQKLDMKTRILSNVFLNEPRIPKPTALCIDKNTLYVADHDLPNAFSVLIDDVNSNASKTVFSFQATLQGKNIQEMACSDGVVYALQSGDVPLARIFPLYQPVSLASPWGFLIDNKNLGADPFLQFQQDVPVGFIPSSKEERQLLIASPTVNVQSIVNVKDFQFDSAWLAGSSGVALGGPTDFDYPKEKPKNTFRILIMGDSRLAQATGMVTKTNPTQQDIEQPGTLAINTFPKQLELLLNMESALKGAKYHYEVLRIVHAGLSPVFFGNEEAIPIVKQYDVDLVIMLWSMHWEYYFFNPITKEGIPQSNPDPEYHLKPLSSRIPPGAPARFYKHCLEKGLIKSKAVFPPNVYWDIEKISDPDIREDMLEMIGKPVKVLSDKLQAMKTSQGTTPKLMVLYTPWQIFPDDDYETFWRDLCDRNQISLIDLAPMFNALRISLYPTSQMCCGRHYTSFGHAMIAYLLSHELIDKKIVPFEIEPISPENK
jgi:hypothetical protein